VPVTPDFRFRRLRRSAALRDLVREARLTVDDFILPLFVEEDIAQPVPIASMPGVVRHTEQGLPQAVQRAWDAGIKAVMLFGVSHHKDADGSDSWQRDGLMARCIRAAKAAVPAMVVISDNCFCEYTEHGHCGVLAGDDVDNDATLANLARQAVVAAAAGADMIAPSGMMDGMVAAMRQGLDEAGYHHLPIMAYSTKFASAFYGPFRDAVDSSFKGNRATYQLDVANAREALAESLQDEREGADLLMVKPGIAFLDVLRDIRQHTSRPLAVYQVSGEYAMIKAAAAQGVIDERAIALETLIAFKRAGADLIITYFAQQAAAWLAEH
jgi:porphobilinogen synthase